MNLLLEHMLNYTRGGNNASQGDIHREYCECGREISPLDGNEPMKCTHGEVEIPDPNTIKTDEEAIF